MFSYSVRYESPNNGVCPLCKPDRHALYSCTRFRHGSTVKVNTLCMNCLNKGRFATDCKSPHRCKKCQNPHHTLLHVESCKESSQSKPTVADVSANTVTVKVKPSFLLMTCHLLVLSPPVKARALIDSGSSASFVFEGLVQSLRLSHNKQTISVSGISTPKQIQSVTQFN